MKHHISSTAALLLAVVLLFASIHILQPAYTAEPDSYQQGYVRIMMEDSAAPFTIPVLYRASDEQVWVNGATFSELFQDYIYDYEESTGVVYIEVHNRQLAFQVGSSESVYKLGTSECFYRINEPVVKYNGEAWIPAEAFFTYLGCNVAAVSKSLRELPWNPQEDFLLIGQPEPVVGDILHEIFRRDNGIYWMFDYEKDLGASYEDLQATHLAATAAVEIYGALTADLQTIVGWAADSLALLVNKFNELTGWFGENEAPTGWFRDQKYIEMFSRQMLNASSAQTEQMKEEAERSSQLLSNLGQTVFSSIGDEITDAWNDELVKLFHSMESDNVWPLFSKDFQDLVSQKWAVEDIFKKGSKALDAAGDIFTLANIYLESQNQDTIMLEGMTSYLNETKNSTIMEETMRNLIEAEIEKASEGSGQFFVSKGFWALIEKYGGNKAADLIGGGAVTSLTSIGWSLIEWSNLFPELGKIGQPEAFNLSLYGIIYENDAWKALAESYLDFVVANGHSEVAYIEDAGYLAANYLKACLITREAALEALSNSDFTQKETYKLAKEKNRQISEMLNDLLTALEKGKDETLEDNKYGNYHGYGVTFNQSLGGNELTFELFVEPWKKENGKQYGYYEPELEVQKITIAPLVFFAEAESGYFIEHMKNGYYWETSVNQYEREVTSGDDASGGQDYYREKPAPSSLMRVSEDGTKEVIYQTTGGTESLYLMGDRLYFSELGASEDYRVRYNLYSCKLDGTDVISYGSGTWEMMDDVGLILLGKNAEGLFVVKHETQEKIQLNQLNNVGNIALFENGIIYYEAAQWDTYLADDHAPFILRSYQIETGEQKEIFRDENTAALMGYDESKGVYTISGGGFPVLMYVQATQKYLYFTYGSFAGSGVFYQGGNLARAAKDGSGQKILAGRGVAGSAPSGIEAQFFVESSGSEDTVYYQLAWMEDGTQAMIVDSGAVFWTGSTKEPFVAGMEAQSWYWTSDDKLRHQWYCYSDSFEEARPIFDSNQLEAFFALPNSMEVNTRKVELTDSWLYYEVAVLKPTRTTNHQFYDLQQLIGCRQNRETGKTEVLYCSQYEDSGLPMFESGAEQKEPETIAIIEPTDQPTTDLIQPPITNLSGLSVNLEQLPFNVRTINLTGGSACQGNGFDYEELYWFSEHQGNILGSVGLIGDGSTRSVIIAGRRYEARCTVREILPDGSINYSWNIVNCAKDGSDEHLMSVVTYTQPAQGREIEFFIAGADICVCWQDVTAGICAKKISVLDGQERVDSASAGYLTFNQNVSLYRGHDQSIYETDLAGSYHNVLPVTGVRQMYLTGNIAVYTSDQSNVLQGYRIDSKTPIQYEQMPVDTETVIAYNYHNVYAVTENNSGDSILRRLNTDTGEVTILAEVSDCQVTGMKAAKDYLFLEVACEHSMTANAGEVSSDKFVIGYNLSSGELYFLGMKID